jgi:hypothetical protein
VRERLDVFNCIETLVYDIITYKYNLDLLNKVIGLVGIIKNLLNFKSTGKS